MMEKYALYRGVGLAGAPHIHLIEPGTRYGLDETSDLCKTASREHLPGVLELVESIQPKPDRLYLLNSALGAGENVGFNMRGDWFTEEGLLHTPKGWDKIPVWDIDGRRQAANQTEKVAGYGDLTWGFPTFMNAHRFRHHCNKDPNRAYGFVLGAFWDERMRRVVLVSELIRSLCEELGALTTYDRIAAGEFPDTSMGAKVPYDICSICGHKARTPAEYCEHVRPGAPPPYGMNALLEDGRRCGVYNTHPRFFDDSLVFVGAERSAKIMSDLTGKVRGKRPYSERVYAVGSPSKEASAIGFTMSNNDMPVQPNMPRPDPSATGARFSDALARWRREAQPSARRESSDRLTEVLDQLRPSSTQEERAVLQLLSKKPTQEKSASSSKWADILKRIPAPTARERSIIAYHGTNTRPFTLESLKALATDPHSALNKTAEAGIVLSPEEFQFVSLYGVAPEFSERLHAEGRVFQTTGLPDDLTSGIHFQRRPVGADKIASVVREYVADRSFAPVAVLNRMNLEYVPVQKYCPAKEASFPGSDVLAELYTDYRFGLLANPPDWRYATLDSALSNPMAAEKLASTAEGMSERLLLLAYWPAHWLG
jgi:hypothetical protein